MSLNHPVWIFSGIAHFTNNNFTTLMSVKEILDQPLFLNSHTKVLNFSSNKPYFHYFPTRNTSDKFIIRDLRGFQQPGLIPSTTLTRNQVFLLPNIKECINLSLYRTLIG